MSVIAPPLEDLIVYPDSDGQPMAENTVQYEWIVRIKGNLDAVFRDRPDVFVAGDNLIYPVKGRNDIRAAPDVYVAFGRPKGDRGSFQVWKEGGVFPQVVFEVLSPGNRAGEMERKRTFYRVYGAEEYYVYDPDTDTTTGCTRTGNSFTDIPALNGWISPRLGVRFDTSGSELQLFRPDGTPFLTFDELDLARIESEREATQARIRADAERMRADGERSRADAERSRAESEKQRAESEQQRAESEKQRAEMEKTRADDAVAVAARMAAKLRQLGIDPATLSNTLP